jgi:hypothetical protein
MSTPYMTPAALVLLGLIAFQSGASLAQIDPGTRSLTPAAARILPGPTQDCLCPGCSPAGQPGQPAPVRGASAGGQTNPGSPGAPVSDLPPGPCKSAPVPR